MLTKTILVAYLTWGFLSTVQTAKTVENCEEQMPASLKGKLCAIRQYKIFKGPDMDKHMDCVLKAVGFVDANGDGDYHKLYKPLNAVEKHPKHDCNLETCQEEAMKVRKERRANAYYKCMLRSTSAKAFKKVFDLKELIRSKKLPPKTKYSPLVDRMMEEINKKICK